MHLLDRAPLLTGSASFHPQPARQLLGKWVKLARPVRHFTGSHHLFGGISESGIDHFLDVFFTARPHLLAYGTAYYATNQNLVTLLDTTSLPSFLLGLGLLVQFDIPHVDITPRDSSTELLPPGADQFTVYTEVLIKFLCGSPQQSREGDKGAHEIVLKLGLAALCTPTVVDGTPGSGSIGITLVALKISGIGDAAVEQILECVLTAILRWALTQVTIPFNVFTLDGISLTLQQGPVADADQIEVFGDIS
jgi:hypothetical protein